MDTNEIVATLDQQLSQQATRPMGVILSYPLYERLRELKRVENRPVAHVGQWGALPAGFELPFLDRDIFVSVQHIDNEPFRLPSV